MKAVKRNLKLSQMPILLVLSMTTLGLAGCSMASTSAQWAEPDDMSSEFKLIDDSVNGWSKKIEKLPLEIHGDLSSATNLSNRIQKNVSPATQRVVIYVDGKEAPEREDFCSISKSFRPVSNTEQNQQVTLRAALCDGPRIVSFARESFKKSSAAERDVASIEKDLVKSLHPPFNFLDVDD